MSGKASTYFPKYQLKRETTIKDLEKLSFDYAGVHFLTEIPRFGATETQKAALRWAAWHTPPVISITHSAPEAASEDWFRDPKESNRHYHPYAFVVATLECLGEKMPRQIEIYFCDVELHEDNEYTHQHVKSKETYIVPLDPVASAHITGSSDDDPKGDIIAY